MQARKPCSGCGRERRIRSASVAVSSPTLAASYQIRPYVQSRSCRCAFGTCSITVLGPVTRGAADVAGHALAATEHLHRVDGEPHLHLLAQQLVRHGVEAAVDLDVIIETDPAAAPIRILVGRRRRFDSACRSNWSNRTHRVVPQPRIGRSFNCSTNAAIALYGSVREKNVWWRSRAGIQHCTTCTPTSTCGRHPSRPSP